MYSTVFFSKDRVPVLLRCLSSFLAWKEKLIFATYGEHACDASSIPASTFDPLVVSCTEDVLYVPVAQMYLIKYDAARPMAVGKANLQKKGNSMFSSEDRSSFFRKLALLIYILYHQH